MSRFQAVFQEDRAEINLSPMLDVVFIMLIFFVVVAAFIDEQGLSVALSGESGDVTETVEAITVRIESEGTFNVNGRVMSRASVAPYVQALHGENPEAGFAVMAHDSVPIRDTAVAIDAGRAIGIEVVAILPMQN
ncbi:MAG: biopolymer transporter ExbD [Woeseiaceae bacterium]|nr:biopolymer transporter ExbD [Woeseiaceae bacterium]